MREILFRGKTIGNEWVYGNLSIIGDVCFINEDMSFNKNVIPETVGQYTGLTDKNGKKIFEGDIVRIKTSCNGEEATEITRVGYDYKFCGFFPMRWEESCDGCDCYFAIEEIEVIGNIHDNRELLKGGVE